MTAVKFKDPLKCPECGAQTHEVYTEANYGRVIIVDQCKRCGGVWFDRWELYFLTDESLKTLEHVDAAAFIAPNATPPVKKSSHECPRCEVELVAFIDPMLPKDAEIKRCAGCHGLWLNRGAIGKYNSRRQELRGVFLNGLKETGRDAPNGKPNVRIEMLKKLQKELDVKSLAYERPAEPQDEPIKAKDFAADLGLLALDALLSMVFKI